MKTSGLMKNVAVVSMLWLGGLSLPAAAALDDNCVINILNRTVAVTPGGTWTLPNVPSSQGRIRARATCIEDDGTTRSGQSDFFTVANNGITQVPEIQFENITPIPSSLDFFFTDPLTFTTVAETFQLTVNATYPDGSVLNVTNSASGINYLSTNPAAVTVSVDGLLTAVRSGVALITARKDGVLISRRVTVNTAGDADSDGLPDDYETANGLDPNDPVDAAEDVDKDGLSALDEFNAGTDINKADTDGDGIKDGEELQAGTDGYVTDPLLADSDGDGLNDGVEVTVGSSPLDGNDANYGAAVIDLSVTPSAVALTFNTINSENSVQLKVEGVLVDGSRMDLTAKSNGTAYSSSDLSVVSFSAVDGEIFAGASGLATVTITYQALSAQVPVEVETFVPTALSALPIPGYANNVDIQGDIAYVAAGNAGLQVVDVSDRANPAIVGSLDTAGVAIDIKVSGTTVYIADGENGLAIMDATDPTAPALLSTLDTAGVAQDLVVEGAYAYIGDGKAGISIVDISNPASPLLVSELLVGGTVKGVSVSGDRLALVTESSLKMVDITDRASPVLLGSLNIANTKDVVLDNIIAYVAAFSTGWRVVDVSDPNAPSIVGGTAEFAPRDVALTDGFAFFAEQLFPNVTPFVNIADVYDPFFQGIVDLSPLGDYAGTGIALDSGYAYITEKSYYVGEDYGSSGDTRLFIAQYRQLVDGQGIAPLVSITSPRDGGVFVQGQPATISVDAFDDVAVVSVTFSIAGNAVFTDTSRPYQYSFTPAQGVTSLALRASAIDLGSNTGQSSVVNVTVQPDGDHDGLGDTEETGIHGTDPADADSDDDLLLDGEEIKLGTNPNLADSDSDGIDDKTEVDQGTDPLDPDTTPPAVTSTTPANGATDIPENQAISIQFDDELQRRSVTSSSVRVLLNGGGTPAPGNVQLSTNAREILWTPSGLLNDYSDYVVEVSGVRDNAGNPLAGTASFSFTTGNLVDIENPTVVSVSPASGTEGVPVNASMVVVLSEPVDPATVSDTSVRLVDNWTGQNVSGIVTLSDDKSSISFIPNQPLAIGRQHQLYLSADTQIADLFGNTLNTTYPYFTTGFDPDGQAPQLVGTNIADGLTGVPLNAIVRVRFDEALNGLSIRNVKLRKAGVDVPVVYELESDRRTIRLTPSAPLDAGTQYQVQIDGVEDLSGNLLPVPVQRSFTTGDASDTENGSIPHISFQDNATVPLNVQLSALLSERADPLSLNENSVWFYDDSLDVKVLGSMALSADGLSLTFIPDEPLVAGHQYYWRLSYYSKLLDLAGNTFNYRYYDNFTAAFEEQTAAPVVVLTNFPNAATEVQANARIVFHTDTLLNPVCVAQADAIVSDGVTSTAMPVALQEDGRTLVLDPATDLDGATAYTVTVNGLCDYAGNASAPFMLSFTTRADTAADTAYPHVTSITPAHQTTGVDPNTHVVIVFDEPVDPVFLDDLRIQVSGMPDDVAGTYVVNGNTITFTPADPFPGDARIYAKVHNIRDLVGNTSYYTGGDYYFDTSPRVDSEAPHVVAQSPMDGATSVSPYVTVALTFNESLNGNTVDNNSFVFYAEGEVIRPGISRSRDNRTVYLSGNLPAGVPVAVVATPDVEDLSGNALGDFVSLFHTAPETIDTQRPSVSTSYPASGYPSSIPQRIVLFFNEAMESSSTLAAFHVSQDGLAVSGTASMQASGRALSFVPDNPLNPGSLVQVFLTDTALDQRGNAAYSYSMYLYMPSTGVGDSAYPLLYSPPRGLSGVPSNVKVQFEFSEELDPVTVTSANVRLYCDYNEVSAALTLSADGRVITLVPDAPLAIDAYCSVSINNLLDTDGDAVGGYYPYFYTGNDGAGGTLIDGQVPSVLSFTPADGATDVPLNTRFNVLFDERVNPISFPRNRRVDILLSDSDRRLSYRPVEILLPADSEVTEVLPAIEDTVGNAIAATQSTFTTTDTIDDQRPAVSAVSPLNDSRDIPRDSAFQLRLDSPVDPTSIHSGTFYLYANSKQLEATIGISADGRTLTLVPDQLLPAGEWVYLYLNGARDIAGNDVYYYSFGFQVGYAEDLTPPQVEQVNLHDGQALVPTNVRMRVRFDQPIVHDTSADIDRFVLRDGSGVAVPVTQVVDSTYREVTLKPIALLQPSASYTLTVSGVLDRAGNVMPADVVTSFTTAGGPDLVAGSVLTLSFQDGVATAPVNTLLQVRLSERVDRNSINTGSVWVYDNTLNILVPGDISLSDEDTVITFTPDQPLQIGHEYYLRVGYYEKLKDLGGNDFAYRYYDNFTTEDYTATSPAVVAQTNFGDGTVDVPVNARFVLQADHPLNPFCVASAQASANAVGGNVPLTLALQSDNRTLILSASGTLQAGTAYALDVSGLCDLAGNPITAYALNFTTDSDAAPDTDYPRLQSIVPAHQATAVDADTDIVLTFDEPVDPTFLDEEVTVTVDGIGNTSVAGSFNVAGSVVTFTPLNPLPGDSRIRVAVHHNKDLAGNSSYYSGGDYYFDTAPRLDNTPPTVLSVSPVDGAMDISPYAPVVLHFNESLNGGTVHNYSFVLWANGQLIRPTVSRSNGNTVVTLDANLPEGTLVAVVATPDVQDLSGNRLGDFVSTFTTGRVQADTSRPSVVAMVKATNGTGTTEKLVLFANKPLAASSLAGSLFVAENGETKSGSVTLKGEQAIEFVPDTPFGEDTKIAITLYDSATDNAGNAFYRYDTTFYTPGRDVGSTPYPVDYSPINYADEVTLNPAIMARFSEPLDPASVDTVSVTLHRSDNYDEVPSTVTLEQGGYVIKVVPNAELQAGTSYYLYLHGGSIKDTDGDSMYYSYTPYFDTGAAATSDVTAPSVVSISPYAGATGVPVNARIDVLVDEPVNPISFPMNRGVDVEFFSDNRRFRYRPSEVLLAAATEHTETVPDIQDLSGNVLNAASTTFTTGDTVAIDRVNIAQYSIANNAVVPRNTRFSVLFDRPVMAHNLSSSNIFIYNETVNEYVSTTSFLSADGRLLTVQPDADLPADSDFYLAVGYGALPDFAGNDNNGTYYRHFSTSDVTDTAAPTVTAQSVLSGTTGVPLNPVLGFRFDKPISSVCLNEATISLFDGASAMVLKRAQPEVSRITLVPQHLLQPGTSYTLTIDGLCDHVGNALAHQSLSFTTTSAGLVDAVSPVVSSVTPYNGATAVPLNAYIEIRVSEDLDASTVVTDKFDLYDITTSSYVDVSVSLSSDLRVIRIVPSALEANHQYRIQAYRRTNGNDRARDLAGHLLWARTDSDWYGYLDDYVFTTSDVAADSTAPSLLLTTIPDNWTDVPLNTRFSIRLDEPMSDLCVLPDTLYLRKVADSSVVNGDLTLSGDRRVLTFSLPAGTLLEADTTYQVVAGNDLCDYAYNTYSFAGSSFTTGSGTQGDTSNPVTIASTPFVAQADVPLNTVIAMYASEPLDPTTVNGDTFSLRDETAGALVSIQASLGDDLQAVYIQPTEALVADHHYRMYGYNYANSNIRAKNFAGYDLWGHPTSSSYGYLDEYHFYTGSTAEDAMAPTILSTTLADGLTGVPTNTRFGIELSETMSPVCAHENNPYLQKDGTSERIYGTLSFDAFNRSRVNYLLPEGVELEPATLYHVSATTLCDSAHNEVAFAGSSFTTGAAGDTTPPLLYGVSPYDESTEVPLNVVIDLLVNDRIDATSAWENTLYLIDETPSPDVTLPITVSLAQGGKVIRVTPTSALEPDHFYRVRAFSQANSNIRPTDYAGNALWGRDNSSSYSYLDDYNFRTGTAGNDTTDPVVEAISPADGQTGVPLNTRVSVRLSERASDSCALPDNFYLQKSAGGDPIIGTISYDNVRRVVVYNLPNGTLLEANTSYDVVVPTLCDLAHNTVTPAAFSFTTGAGPDADVTHPYLSGVVPADGSNTVPVNQVIELSVSERLDAATVFDGSFYLYDASASAVVATTVTLSGDGQTVIITPDADLESGHSYRIYGYRSGDSNIRATDLSGNALWGRSDSSSSSYLDDYDFITQ